MYMYLHVHFGYGFVTKLFVVVFYNSTLQRDVHVSTCTFWVLFCAVSMHSGRGTWATCLYVRKYVVVYTSMEVHICMCSFMHRCIHILCWVFVVCCCSEAVASTTHCNTLQHTATHCNKLQCNKLQRTATHCITLNADHVDGARSLNCSANPDSLTLQHTTTRCNTLQHAATRCTTLQHSAIHCSTLQH